MARCILTQQDVFKLFFYSGDETVSHEEEEVEFEPNTVEDVDESFDEWQSSDDKDMDISNASDNVERDADENVFRLTDSVWIPYASTGSDLHKFSVNVSNPNIRLHTSKWYEDAISFFSCFLILQSRNLFRKQTCMHKEKI